MLHVLFSIIFVLICILNNELPDDEPMEYNINNDVNLREDNIVNF